jgi:hypothetical protein
VPTRPDDVAAFAEAAGAPLDPSRYALLAATLDAFAPLLGSLETVTAGEEEPPAVYDARW